MEDPLTMEGSKIQMPIKFSNSSGHFLPGVFYTNPVTTSILAIVISILWWRSKKHSLLSPRSSSKKTNNEHHNGTTTNQSNDDINSSNHDTSSNYIIHGPNSVQTMVYQVTTPPLSKKNIPVFASAQSLQYNSNIYQTLELHLEHLYLEQIYHIHGNSCSNGGDGGGSINIANPGASSVCSDNNNIKQAGDNIAPTINSSGIKNENMDQTRDFHDSTTNNATNNKNKNVKKKKKKTSIVIPIQAIINVTAQGPNNLATLILTINTKLVDQFQRDERNHMNNTNNNNSGNQQNKKNGSTSSSSPASNNTNNNNGGISTPYYNLVHNQVTIDNWKIHHSLSGNEESCSITDHVKESDMISYSENSSDEEDYNEESEILDEINEYDEEEEKEEEDVASTIQNDDLLSKFTLGKIQTSTSHDSDTQSRLHDDSFTLQNIHNRKRNQRNIQQKKAKRNRNRPLQDYNESDVVEKEFTFASYQEAASFQTTFLAMRTVGKEIRNMYSALEAIHLDIGSSQIGNFPAHRDTHDDENVDLEKHDDDKAVATFLSPRHFGIQRYQNVGVHLFDVQYCLGELPYIARILSNYCSNRHSQLSSTATDATQGLNAFDNSKRQASKRIKLGYKDFFKLLVPSTFIGTPYCSPAALEGIHDGIEAHQVRAKQLIQLRERVSAVALRVCSYVNAMKVVREGWNIECDDLLSCSTSENEDLKRRFAFDQDWMNSQHDDTVTNEYYEPLREKEIRRIGESENDSFMLQAYSLVNCHFVKYDKDATNQINGNSRLHPKNDPALAIPSLKKLLKKHSEKHFFVFSYFHENSSTASIMLFVRNLAEHDTYFDEKLNDLIHGQESTCSSLELSTQIGPTIRLSNFSFLRLALLQMKSSVLRLFQSRATNIPFTVCSETNRMSFLSMKLSPCFKVRRFVGSTTTSSNSSNGEPCNYFSITCEVHKSILHNYPRKVISDENVQSNNIVDCIFHLKGSQRPLGVIRLVKADLLRARLTLGDPHSNVMDSSNISNHSEHMQSEEQLENEAYKSEVETLREILTCITVPIRSKDIENPSPINPPVRCSLHSNKTTEDVQVLSLINEGDLRRHLIAARLDLKEAAVRVVQCAAWRALTFPIDLRACQIELTKYQSFCQGTDNEGNPIFYFFNMCRGLWSKDVDASMLAILHRFENATDEFLSFNPDFKFTLIILMGKPFLADDQENESESRQDKNDHEDENSNETSHTNKTEAYHIHTNFQLVQKLIKILRDNYPERLSKALIIPNGGWEKFLGIHGLRRYIPSDRTRQKIVVLDELKDLLQYANENQLSTLVGGTIPAPRH